MIPAMENRHSGFTVVELLITMVLAGLLLALAIPSYSRFVASSRVLDQTNELVAALTLGRSEAIRRNATITLCRTSTAVSVDCPGTDANWTNWVLMTAGGTVVRRGTFNDFGGSQVVRSSLTNERVDFGSDGLGRTGGALLSADPLNPHFFIVCSKRYSNENIRRLTLGGGSRISNTRESGTCS